VYNLLVRVGGNKEMGFIEKKKASDLLTSEEGDGRPPLRGEG